MQTKNIELLVKYKQNNKNAIKRYLCLFSDINNKNIDGNIIEI